MQMKLKSFAETNAILEGQARHDETLLERELARYKREEIGMWLWLVLFFLLSVAAVGCGNVAAQVSTFQCATCAKQVDYDTPPKVWEQPRENRTIAQPEEPEKTTITRRTCEDKNRFLLMSEDGKWHCLNLAVKP